MCNRFKFSVQELILPHARIKVKNKFSKKTIANQHTPITEAFQILPKLKNLRCTLVAQRVINFV